MPYRCEWSMAPTTFSHDTEVYYQPGYQSYSHHETDTAVWQSPTEHDKQLWSELPQITHMTAAYPDYPCPLVLSPIPRSYAPVAMNQETDAKLDTQWSPTLTNSSTMSSTPPLPLFQSMSSVADYAPSTICEPSSWLVSDLLNQPTAHTSDHSLWQISGQDNEESLAMPTSGASQMPIRGFAERLQHPEVQVQALLDRPRRIKTTAENARYYCVECDKGFQRVYNLRSHMLKHEVSRQKMRCTYSGCDKCFDRKTDLGRHERSVHLHLREHQCVLCASCFARKDTLVRHIEGSCSKRTGVERKRAQSRPSSVGLDSKKR